jgi:two-component system, NarL family, response regulator DegU
MTIRLMLVDDHSVLRQGMRRTFEEEGYDVVAEAGDGNEAIRLAAQLRPDVIVMDVTMPGMTGVEATKRICEANPEQRIVMLTMHVDQSVMNEALQAGAVGYITKDCTTDEILDIVKQAADPDLTLSPFIAASMLVEARKLNAPHSKDEDRIITRREEEVLQLIADGCSTPEVAAKLYISQKTVKNHLASIYEKLNARDRTQAVLLAVRMGIVKLN